MAVTISWTPSRTSGWAPCAVFFDATATTSTLTSHPFRDLTFIWEIHDGSTVAYRRGGVQFYVFRNIGTGTVKLTVIDTDGTQYNSAVTNITVTDQDAQFSGANTICFSTSGDFTGAPTGAQQVTISTFNDAVAYAGNGKRLLFRRGETFTATTNVVFDYTDFMIGAFGAGSGEDPRFHFYSNDPIIQAVDGNTYSQWDALIRFGTIRATIQHLRVLDLTTTTQTPSAAVDGTTGKQASFVLIDRVEMRGFDISCGYSPDSIPSGDPLHENIFMSNCHLHDTKDLNNMNVYWGGEYMGIYNCEIHDSGSHNVRYMYAWKAVVDYCKLYNPEYTRHCLKIHGQADRAKYRDYTEYINIVNNDIQIFSIWNCQLGPENSGADEWGRRFVIESNRFHAIGNTTTHTDTLIHLSYPESAVRNNRVWTMMSHGWEVQLVSLQHYGDAAVPDPTQVVVENNSFYSNSGDSDHPNTVRLIYSSTTWANTEARNNLTYSPVAVTVATIHGGGSLAVDLNNSTGNPSWVDPANGDFTLSAGSSAIGGGTSTSNAKLDAAFALRDASPDQGALEKDATVWGSVTSTPYEHGNQLSAFPMDTFDMSPTLETEE